jgi:hypothetical protein
MLNTYYIALACVLVIYLQSRYTEHQLLRGFWCADADFCQRADLQKFILYIGDQQASGRVGYMLVVTSAGIIINNPIKINTTCYTLNPLVSHDIKYSVNIAWYEDADFKTKAEHEEEAFPSKCSGSFQPFESRLTLYTDDTTHVILYRDN